MVGAAGIRIVYPDIADIDGRSFQDAVSAAPSRGSVFGSSSTSSSAAPRKSRFGGKNVPEAPAWSRFSGQSQGQASGSDDQWQAVSLSSSSSVVQHRKTSNGASALDVAALDSLMLADGDGYSNSGSGSGSGSDESYEQLAQFETVSTAVVVPRKASKIGGLFAGGGGSGPSAAEAMGRMVPLDADTPPAFQRWR